MMLQKPSRQPELYVPGIVGDDNGRLTDEPTRMYIRQLLEALRDWTLRVRPCEPLVVEP